MCISQKLEDNWVQAVRTPQGRCFQFPAFFLLSKEQILRAPAVSLSLWPGPSAYRTYTAREVSGVPHTEAWMVKAAGAAGEGGSVLLLPLGPALPR